MKKIEKVFSTTEESQKFLDEYYQTKVRELNDNIQLDAEKGSLEKGPLTVAKIMDNTRGRNKKKDIGVRMKDYNDPNGWKVHVSGDEVYSGAILELDISNMGVIAIGFNWYYIEFVNGKWVYVPNFGSRTAPAGKYFSRVRVGWISSNRKSDVNHDDLILEFEYESIPAM